MMMSSMFSKPILVFGCGNTLFGDDGFGPEVIDYLLANHELGRSVAARDVGTSIREILFDLLIAKQANMFLEGRAATGHHAAIAPQKQEDEGLGKVQPVPRPGTARWADARRRQATAAGVAADYIEAGAQPGTKQPDAWRSRTPGLQETCGPSPRTILIVDATEQDGLEPGQLTELTPTSMAACKSNDFSVHQFPSLNMLEELDSQEGVEVAMLAVKAAEIPGQVRPGLSPAVATAIPLACAWLLERIDAALRQQPWPKDSWVSPKAGGPALGSQGLAANQTLTMTG